MSGPAHDRRSGTVTAFDVHRGLGGVTDDSGTVWPFHCVSIADGSRDIAVGTRVMFNVEFRVKRDEAVAISPV
ncbi:MAG: hypothetical protein ACKOFF_09000 [Acidimicrobiales bacterium]